MRFFNLIVSLVLFSTVSAAWPSWDSLLGVERSIENALARRQNDNNNDNNNDSDNTAEPAFTVESDQPEETGDNDSDNTSEPTVTNTRSDDSEETGDNESSTRRGSQRSSSGRPARTSSVSVDPVAPQGQIVMLTPAQTSSTYIPIGSGHTATFVWNYTNLVLTPSRIDVIASNTDGAWTIAGNVSVEETGSVEWDTGDLETPLPMEQYTFVVYDSEEGPTAAPGPGKLSPYQNYPFAMYSPKARKDADEFFCVTCNSGVTSAERQSIKVLMFVATLTVASFTYFACGFLG